MKAFLPLNTRRWGVPILSLLTVLGTLLVPVGAWAAPPGKAMMAHHAAVGEDSLVVPTEEFARQTFMGVTGQSLLMLGFVVCFLGLAFGLVVYSQLKNAPVHKSMLEISELIYETCKTYLFTQLKFIAVLEAFIAVVIVAYYGVIKHESIATVVIILLFSVVGIAGSSAVAWFGIRINTFANSRTAFASLRGKPFPVYAIPLKAGMSIGMVLISIELMLMLGILLFIPGNLAGKCFIGFAIGESLGASALRIAGGIFTKIADIGSDLMKIVFKIKEDDARNPGVIADCTGDNAGDSVGPSADGFETYGVTGVALISFILLAIANPSIQVQLLVWIFVMRIVMVIASALSYFVNEAIAKARYGAADKMNFEAPSRRSYGSPPSSRSSSPSPSRWRSFRPSAATIRSGGNSRSSSPVGRWPAPSSPSSSRSSRPPSRPTCARSSRRRAKGGRRSTSWPASPRATSAASGSASR